MLEEKLIERVKESIDDLNHLCIEYIGRKQEYENLLGEKKRLEIEEKEVREKEKKQDKFLEVILLAKREVSEVDELSKRRQQIENQLESLSDNLNSLRTEILRRFKESPFPIDPYSSTLNGTVTKFRTIEGVTFKEEAIRVLCELLDTSYPLQFEEITYTANEVTVNATSVDEAINKIVQSVQALRLKISELLNAYSSIDALCERIKNSSRCAPILEALYLSEKPLSVDELAERTGLDKNLTYQACYNLLRDRWTPNPIRRTSDGKFSLTTTGEIMMKRYREKYGIEHQVPREGSL